MAAQDVHQVVEASRSSSRLNVDIIPRILDKVDRIDRVTKRLSLTPNNKCCDKCGQKLPIYLDKCGQKLQVPSRSSFRNSFKSIKINFHDEEPVCNKVKEVVVKVEDAKLRRGLPFWLIILAVTMVGIVSALEGTIVGTALSTIVQELGGAEWYIWTVNAYFLTSTVFVPLYGQTANIFGRRFLMILALTIFLIGSALCGAAHNIKILIAGRAIQGVGGGGLGMLGHLIVCDIVPLRERGSFMAIIYMAITVGTGIGPFVGGSIVQHTSWRWVFLLNLPIGGLALLLVIAFLQVSYNKESTIQAKLKRVDYIGNAIFIPSAIAILLALTYGGTIYPWSSWQVILLLAIGFVGLGGFAMFEWSECCLEPTMPPRLFTNRTTVAALALSFIDYMLLYWVIYYLPVYFQSVQGSSPSRSGVQLLPFVLVMIPFAAIGGKLLARCGRYRMIHIVGFALMLAGLGLMTMLDATSSMAAWACYPLLVAIGCGLVSSTVLPAVQAALDDKDTATATGTWGFIRSFGMLWGVAIPAAVFNNQINALAYRISDPAIRSLLSNGRAYEYATDSFVKLFYGTVKAEIISVYSDSLKLVWQVAIGISGLGFLLCFVEKEINLRTDQKTDYGVKEEKQAKTEASAEV